MVRSSVSKTPFLAQRAQRTQNAMQLKENYLCDLGGLGAKCRRERAREDSNTKPSDRSQMKHHGLARFPS